MGPDLTQTDIIVSSFLNQFPNLKLVPTDDIDLLGAPLFPKGRDTELISRFSALKLMCSRLENLEHHDVLFLLKNAFLFPNFFIF